MPRSPLKHIEYPRPLKELIGSVYVFLNYSDPTLVSENGMKPRTRFESAFGLAKGPFWVRSEQMLADVLTKAGVDATYVKLVATSAMWRLGPDARCPSTRRNRSLRPPKGMETVTVIQEVPDNSEKLLDYSAEQN